MIDATLIRNARVLTMLAPGEGAPPKGGRRGRELGTLGVLPRADVLIEEDRVTRVDVHDGSKSKRPGIPASVPEVDAAGRVLMPGFVDCHTHACWAGSRVDEWERKLAGATYQEIMASGGGIMSTVRAVRDATVEDLAETLYDRLERMAFLGSTTVEVKTGYGLTLDAERKMLAAMRELVTDTAASVVRTLLLGHAIDPEIAHDVFVNDTIESTLPALSRLTPPAFPRPAVDAFCEKGAWSLADCVRLFEKAKQLGHPIRVHADQFTSMGMIPEAIRLGALSVDHLEATEPEDLALLAKSETFGVMLPVCGFHLDGRYADGRGFLERNGKLCIATNDNPGSAPCPSMPFAIALAVRHLKLTPAEAIGAATVNPAALLGLADRGYITPGALADLILLRHDDERALAYEVGDNPVAEVWVAGERLT